MNLIRRFDPARPRSVVVAAVLLGVLSGIFAASFMRVTGEPWVDKAIALEEANAATEEAAHPAAAEASAEEDHGHDEAFVSRSDQKGFGLFAAFILVGAALGLFFAGTFLGLRKGQPDVLRRSLTAGAILAGAFTVAPWLKYPPTPPAVGDPGTINERQWQYVAMIFFAFLVLLGAARLSSYLRGRGWANDERLVAVAAAVIIPMALLVILLPAPSDPINAPANLVWHFRLASLGGNLLLWTILSLGFGSLAMSAERALGRAHQPQPAAPPGLAERATT